MRSRRSATALFAALVGIAALSACGSSGSSVDASDTTAAPVTTATSSGTATTTTATSMVTSGPASTAAPAAGSGCVAAHLQVTLGEGGAAAGNRYQTLVLTNNGTTACTLKGYPGVSLRDASGSRIGGPADREAGTVAAVSLAARGGQASFFLHTTADTNGTGCQPPSATIAVIAPNDTVTMSVPGKITVCGTFTVGPVVAGTTGHG